MVGPMYDLSDNAEITSMDKWWKMIDVKCSASGIHNKLVVIKVELGWCVVGFRFLSGSFLFYPNRLFTAHAENRKIEINDIKI